ncbi:FAD-dependent oxidoreductase [uncultured Amnibacterium sp.]|uniref:FAD-dependent oxidoreductase n=1 Tax=uncultured Amnibacterium sp. TaxID=1631851 RepID=UPI0035C943C2
MEPECDLLVVGGGVAGASAAIAAADLGLDVLLIEKTGRPGGSALWSGGNLLDLQGPGALPHLRSLSFGRTDDAVLGAYADGLAGLRGRLESLGARTEDVPWLPHCWPHLPGAESVAYYRVAGAEPAGPALWGALARALDDRGVRVRTHAALARLTTEHDRVTGARIATADGEQVVRARAGVVLATGGFEASADLKAAYLPVPDLVPVAGDGNTGDGLRAAQQVGAALWHMSTFFGFWAFQPPGGASAIPVLPLGRGFLLVDASGRRFHAEAGREAHDLLRPVGDVLPGRDVVPSLPATLIVDDALLAAGPLAPFPAPDRAPWSADNDAELDRGWFVTADSPTELAAALGMDPATLTATVEAFETAAEQGGDAFGRDPGTMAPLTGRLHALPVWPGAATTSGGPRRDAGARVVRWDGSPVPGLFAAGGLGSVWGHLTHHGGGLTDGLVFGAIAARSAAEAMTRR